MPGDVQPHPTKDIYHNFFTCNHQFSTCTKLSEKLILFTPIIRTFRFLNVLNIMNIISSGILIYKDDQQQRRIQNLVEHLPRRFFAIKVSGYKVVNSFRQKAPGQMFDWVQNTTPTRALMHNVPKWPDTLKILQQILQDFESVAGHHSVHIPPPPFCWRGG